MTTQTIVEVYRDLLLSLLADAVSAGVVKYISDTGEEEPVTNIFGPLDDEYNVEMITTKRQVIISLVNFASNIIFWKGK